LKRSLHVPGKNESLSVRPRIGAALAIDLTFSFLLLGLCPSALGQQKATEDQVKAAYLLNFAKLAEWPQSALPDGSSPLVIGVSGGDEDFVDVLRALVAGKLVGTHPVEVKSVGSLEEMKSCHIVFLRASERKRTRAAIEGIGQRGVLFMGEDESFLGQGGMINLFRDRGSVQFEVNADALDHSEIHFSAKILALAKAGSGPSRTAVLNSPAEGIRQEGTRRLEHNVVPEYPEIAERMKLVGIVQVEAIVNPDGTVREVRVIGGHPLLAEAMVRAVKQWKYQPAPKETVEPIKFSFGMR
jgi:TonB family protein